MQNSPCAIHFHLCKCMLPLFPFQARVCVWISLFSFVSYMDTCMLLYICLQLILWFNSLTVDVCLWSYLVHVQTWLYMYRFFVQSICARGGDFALFSTGLIEHSSILYIIPWDLYMSWHIHAPCRIYIYIYVGIYHFCSISINLFPRFHVFICGFAHIRVLIAMNMHLYTGWYVFDFLSCLHCMHICRYIHIDQYVHCHGPDIICIYISLCHYLDLRILYVYMTSTYISGSILTWLPTLASISHMTIVLIYPYDSALVLSLS